MEPLSNNRLLDDIISPLFVEVFNEIVLPVNDPLLFEKIKDMELVLIAAPSFAQPLNNKLLEMTNCDVVLLLRNITLFPLTNPPFAAKSINLISLPNTCPALIFSDELPENKVFPTTRPLFSQFKNIVVPEHTPSLAVSTFLNVVLEIIFPRFLLPPVIKVSLEVILP